MLVFIRAIFFFIRFVFICVFLPLFISWLIAFPFESVLSFPFEEMAENYIFCLTCEKGYASNLKNRKCRVRSRTELWWNKILKINMQQLAHHFRCLSHVFVVDAHSHKCIRNQSANGVGSVGTWIVKYHKSISEKLIHYSICWWRRHSVSILLKSKQTIRQNALSNPQSMSFDEEYRIFHFRFQR